MAYTLGSLIGGVIGGYLFFTLFAWLFRKLSPSTDAEPTSRAAKHGIPAVITIYVIVIGLNWGEPEIWMMSLFYVPGIALGWWDLHRRYVKGWSSESELEDTFR